MGSSSVHLPSAVLRFRRHGAVGARARSGRSHLRPFGPTTPSRCRPLPVTVAVAVDDDPCAFPHGPSRHPWQRRTVPEPFDTTVSLAADATAQFRATAPNGPCGPTTPRRSGLPPVAMTVAADVGPWCSVCTGRHHHRRRRRRSIPAHYDVVASVAPDAAAQFRATAPTALPDQPRQAAAGSPLSPLRWLSMTTLVRDPHRPSSPPPLATRERSRAFRRNRFRGPGCGCPIPSNHPHGPSGPATPRRCGLPPVTVTMAVDDDPMVRNPHRPSSPPPTATRELSRAVRRGRFRGRRPSHPFRALAPPAPARRNVRTTDRSGRRRPMRASATAGAQSHAVSFHIPDRIRANL